MRAGWYIHHHGTGHLQRFLLMRRHVPGLVGFSSLPRPNGLSASEWICLPDDAPAAPTSDPTAGARLHWAPLGHAGLRGRMGLIAQWVLDTAPDVFVVDVSVEIAAFVRLMGVPIVWIGQRGRRLDPPHQLAYGLSRVVVPWTEAVGSRNSGLPTTTAHVGALSRFDHLHPAPVPDERRVALVLGGGGHAIAPAAVRAAQSATPGWSWRIAGLGPGNAEDQRPETIWALLQDADVVIGSAGTNVVAEVAAARRPFVCLPQARPYGEQLDQAEALDRAGLAIALADWPAAEEWPAVLTAAASSDPERWSLLHDRCGAQRLARVIHEAACASV